MRLGTLAMFVLLIFATVGAGCSRDSTPASPGSQLTSRSIVSGTVNSESGGTIAGANLTLTEDPAATGAASARTASPSSIEHHDLKTTSDAAGQYQFEAVFAGDYVLKIEAAGFETNFVPFTISETGQPNELGATTVNVMMRPLTP